MGKENVSSNSHDQAMQNYCEAQNVQNVCNLLKGKQNLINELNYQASKVMNAKAEQSKKLLNLMGKKRKSCQTDAQRKKISRTGQTPEKKEEEKKADQARKQHIRSQQTPEKKEQEKNVTRNSMAKLRSTQTPEKKEEEKKADQ